MPIKFFGAREAFKWCRVTQKLRHLDEEYFDLWFWDLLTGELETRRGVADAL
jgi:hypothetical protein